MFDKWGLAEQLFQGGAFFFREPLIFELERLAEYLCKLLHPVPRRLHSLLDFPDQLLSINKNLEDFSLYHIGGNIFGGVSVIIPLYLILFCLVFPILFLVYRRTQIK